MHDDATQGGPETFAAFVRRKREAMGLTQVELSDRAGMSQEWASNVETGKVKAPRLTTLTRLADVFGVDVAELFVRAGYAGSQTAAATIPHVAEGQALYDAHRMKNVAEYMYATINEFAATIAGTPEGDAWIARVTESLERYRKEQ